MKWIALVKAFDHVLCGEWHSGSCTYFKSEYGLDTKQEAEQAVQDIIEKRFHNDTNRYKFTTIVLSYDERQYAESVEKMFKYM